MQFYSREQTPPQLKFYLLYIWNKFSCGYCTYGTYTPVAYAGFYHGRGSARPKGPRCEARSAESGVSFMWKGSQPI